MLNGGYRRPAELELNADCVVWFPFSGWFGWGLLFIGGGVEAGATQSTLQLRNLGSVVNR